MEKNGFEFNQLWMIESLEDDELKTGTILFEKTWQKTAGQPNAFDCHYRNCKTSKEFYAVLAEIEEQARTGKLPLIHIECHGAEEKNGGLSLADHSLVSWKELTPYIQSINVKSKVNLFLVIAACFGADAQWMGGFAGFKRAPFYALIGPKEKLMPRELLNVFKAFYEEFLNTLDISEALMDANTEVRKFENSIQIVCAEEIFDFSAANAPFTGKEKQINKEEILTEVMKNPLISRQGVTKARLLVREANKPEVLLKKIKQKYFCFDLYPENTKRF